MPRVHFVKKARKDNRAVKKGEPYYYWTFRYGGKQYSATYPRQSQLCSGKNGGFYAAIEELEDVTSVAIDIAVLESARDEAVSQLECVRDEYQEGFDNMAENFQYGDTGQQIEEAVCAIDDLINELESWEKVESDFDQDDYDVEDYADKEEWQEDMDIMRADSEVGALNESGDALADIAQCHSFPF